MVRKLDGEPQLPGTESQAGLQGYIRTRRVTAPEVAGVRGWSEGDVIVENSDGEPKLFAQTMLHTTFGSRVKIHADTLSATLQRFLCARPPQHDQK